MVLKELGKGGDLLLTLGVSMVIATLLSPCGPTKAWRPRGIHPQHRVYMRC